MASGKGTLEDVVTDGEVVTIAERNPLPSPLPLRRRVVFLGITVCVCVAIILVCCEVLLRMTGHTPWRYEVVDRNEPTVHEPDSTLGWRNKEGRYIIPPYWRGSESIHMAFLESGRRATGRLNRTGQRKLIVVGGSFTQGWAISDEETYPWKLQAHYPSIEVLNYGTGGYGTYQSLLVLERELARLERPALVIYGFFAHHEVRNVADDEWLRILSGYSKRAHVAVPYGTVDSEGRFVRHALEQYIQLPFREWLATVAYVEKLYMKMTASGRRGQQQVVTKAILEEMNRLCARYGTTLLVVMLNADEAVSMQYLSFLKEARIPSLDCNFPLTEDMRVLGEGHPNGRMNTLWADCIQKGLTAAGLDNVWME